MIVTCPNCGARYRLNQPVAPGARMRCAECQYRWSPDAAEDTDAVPAPVGAAQVAAGLGEGEAAEPTGSARDADREPDAEPEADTAVADPPPRSRWLATFAAVVTGAGLSAVAGGLWIGDRLPEVAERLPGLAVLIDAAPPLPITLAAQGTTAALPSGRAVLEVRGTIVNPSPHAVTLPPLVATLAGPRGVALRWTIAPPVPFLPAGQSVAVAATVTGFPSDATTLSITATR